MNLSQLAVRRPISVSVGVIVVLVLGLLSLSNLGLDLFPDLQLPYVTIATVYPAADPLTIEEEVTRPIEDVVSTISGVRRVQSTSMENMSIVTAEFGWGTAVETVMEDIRAQMSVLSLRLPTDAQTPFVTRIDPTQLPVMIIGLTSAQGAEYTTNRAEADIRPALEQVPGVAQVALLGGVQREIQVLYHSDKLAQHDLTPAMLQQLLSLQNALVPAGIIEHDGARLHTRVGNHFADVQEIRDLVIGESRLPVQGIAALWPPLLHVKDVADVVDGIKTPAGSARIDGQDTVLLQVLKRPGANTVQVTQGLKRALERLSSTAPDLQFSIVIDQSVQIVSSLYNLVLFGSIGALLAIGVLFFFLRTWRSILVIATAIPLSIIVTIAALYFTNVSLNLMTLGGLSLGIGMLVDNAIIVLESIFRHRSQGAGPDEAAIAGSKEVSGAVVAATVTTVVVFLPVLFMDTFVARLFRELGLTVSLSLFASLIVSLTVVPAMAATLLRRREKRPAPATGRTVAPTYAATSPGLAEVAAAGEASDQPLAGSLGQAYEKALGWALDHKALVIIPVLALIASGALLWPRLGLQFLPDSPTRAMYVSMETAPGTPLAQSEAVADEAANRLDQLGVFQFVSVQVGEQQQDDLISILSDHRPTSIKLIAVGKTPFYGARMHDMIRATRHALADLPVEYVSVSNAWESDANLFTNDVVLRLLGRDYDELETLALQLHKGLQHRPEVAEVRVALADQQPEMYLAVDQSRALIGGLTTGQISLAVRHALTGVQATQVQYDGHTIPVVLRPHDDELTDLQDLLNFRVSSPVVTGRDDGSVRLGNVVEARLTTAPQMIRRVDGARAVEVRIKPAGTDLRALHNAIDAVLAQVEAPPGAVVQEAGVMEHVDESMRELAFALVFSLLLVYLVMVVQFESWLDPLIILSTTPLTALGVLWALWLTDTSLSVMPMLGLIILGGIVVNNGILLVDYMGQVRTRLGDVRRAILIGARTRLRPVLMTATTTIGGMLPLALSKGEGMEMQGPLAVTVIGGLLVSTFLTLFIVPTLYGLFHESRRTGRSAADKAAGSPTLALVLAVTLLGGGLLGFAAPAHAQTGTGPRVRFSQPTWALGVGYDQEDTELIYMVGAGWQAYVGDVDWIVYAGSALRRHNQGTWLLAAEGNWFQPISFAGYYELNGVLSVRPGFDGRPTAALSLTGDAVLGNVTVQVEYDQMGAAFPQLPWDVPGRLTPLLDAPGMRRLRGEWRQQPQRDFNLVREFQWMRRLDEGDKPGALLAMTGVEVRTGRHWLVGKVGVRVDDAQWQPALEIGANVRPNPQSTLEIRLAASTVWAPTPALAAVFHHFRPEREYKFRIDVQPGPDQRVLPSFTWQSIPRRQGIQWQLAFEASAASPAASFGIVTTF